MILTPAWISAAAAVFTLAVVATSAHVALRQLDLIRVSNHATTLLTLSTLAHGPEVHAARQYVYEGNLEGAYDRLGSGAEQKAVLDALRPALPVLFLYETIAACVLYKMLEAGIALSMFETRNLWKQSAPMIRLARRVSGSPAMFNKFEALAAMAADHRDPAWPQIREDNGPA